MNDDSKDLRREYRRIDGDPRLSDALGELGHALNLADRAIDLAAELEAEIEALRSKVEDLEAAASEREPS